MNSKQKQQVHHFFKTKGLSDETIIKWILIIENSILQASENNPINPNDVEILESNNHITIFVNGIFGKINVFDSSNILK